MGSMGGFQDPSMAAGFWFILRFSRVPEAYAQPLGAARRKQGVILKSLALGMVADCLSSRFRFGRDLKMVR